MKTVTLVRALAIIQAAMLIGCLIVNDRDDSLIYRIIILYIDHPALAANSLVLSAVKGTACPGGDLVYNCTVSSTSMQFTMRWREAMTVSPSVFYLYDEPETHTVKSLDDFTTTASIIPPNYTLTSIATLSGALLSHNNFVLECFLGTTMNPESPDTIVTKGFFIM